MSTHTVSFSELDATRQCSLKSYLSYRERWQPEVTAPALSRGKLWHSVMEAHYKPGIVPGWVSPWQVLADAGETDDANTCRWMYEGYLERYGTDPDWEVVAVEQKVEESLRLPSGRKSKFVMKGFVDLLVRDHSCGGGLFIVDHKSARELPKQKALDFDDQLGIYTWLLRRQGLDIRGAIHNTARTYKLKSKEMSLGERFSRTLTVRTDRELEIMVAECLRTFQAAYKPLRDGELPPRSPDPDRCSWRCSFGEPCLAARKGGDIAELLTDFGFTQNWGRH